MSVRTSVRPQKVSSISMKVGIQVVLDERCKKVYDHARIQDPGPGHRDPKVAKTCKITHIQSRLSPLPKFAQSKD